MRASTKKGIRIVLESMVSIVLFGHFVPSAFAENWSKLLFDNSTTSKTVLIEINRSKEKLTFHMNRPVGATDLEKMTILWLVSDKKKAVPVVLKKMESSQSKNDFPSFISDSDKEQNYKKSDGIPSMESPIFPNPSGATNGNLALNSSSQVFNEFNDHANSSGGSSNSGSNGNGPRQNENSPNPGAGTNFNGGETGGGTSGGASGYLPPPPPNHPPTANAGSDLTVSSGNVVTLNGGNSLDPDHDSISYRWVQTGGTAVVLNGSDSQTPQFTAPLAQTILIFELTVTDLHGLSASDTVSVTVNNRNARITNRPPIIDQGTNLTLQVTSNPSQALTLSATDIDAQPNTLIWSFSVLPQHGTVYFTGNRSQVTVSSGDTIQVYYVPQNGYNGPDQFNVFVDDGVGGSAEAVVNVSVAPMIYVDNDGSLQTGFNPGDPIGSVHNPYPTFEEGMLNLPSGAALLIQPGNYDWTGPVNLIDRPITIQGAGNPKPLIVLQTYVALTAQASGSQFKNLDLTSDGNMFLLIQSGENVNDILVDGIHLIGTATWNGLMWTGDSSPNGVNDNWTIRNSVFECSRDQYSCVTFKHHNNLLVENNVFRHLGPTIINVSNVIALYIKDTRGDIFIRGNVFTQAGGNGIHIDSTNFDYGQPGGDFGHVYIVNNTFYGMRSGGGDFYTGAIYEFQNDETIVNNLFVGNEADAIHGWNILSGFNPDGSWVDYNLYYNNNGTSDNSQDDRSNFSPTRYTVDSFTHEGPDINPQLLSQTYGDPNFLRFQASSPAASGALNQTIPGYPYSVLTKNGEAYFGAQEPTN